MQFKLIVIRIVLNHHNTGADGVFIRDLCLLKENNIMVDDQEDLTSTELSFMIDHLCTSQYHYYFVLILVFF